MVEERRRPINAGEARGGPVDRGDAVLSLGQIDRIVSSPPQDVDVEGLVLAAQRRSPHVDTASLTLKPLHGRPRSLAMTDDLARLADQMQYETAQGPCLDAADGDAPVLVDDLSTDHRWPLFAPAVASELGIHNIYSVRLQLIDQRAAANFYAQRPTC